ncbi:hypothetical protein MNEG_4037 [Monoraphidium neglectum]|uniref:Uncharacterized protein n=1 Tax=Monoraphidium neglectum TaxID=145388 RepID=A0A0D2MTV3_9CHLO|nr:hypothetical protein MNEG_4037 [Monoraphidium neglectum]KIZ03922.1 hypothetical protein MNEG_4037 [Monoraphidium neglectum]|eukprot:XP_013902941.1 hypothetical protein MNEG_4037 [Monoraphidium neglectum]
MQACLYGNSFGTEAGAEGSGYYRPAGTPPAEAGVSPEEAEAQAAKHDPPVDSIRHVMGKVNQAVGGSYDFEETGGARIRDMAHEIAGNASEPLERAANTTGDGVMGVVGAATDTAAGARDKASDMATSIAGSARGAAEKVAGSARSAAEGAREMGARAAEGVRDVGGRTSEAARDLGSKAAQGARDVGDRAVEGAEAGSHGLGERTHAEGSEGGQGGRGGGGADGRTGTP